MAGHRVDAAAFLLETRVSAKGTGCMLTRSWKPKTLRKTLLPTSSHRGLPQSSSLAAALVSANSRIDVGSTTWVTRRHISAHHWRQTSWPTCDRGECTASTWC